MKLKEFLFLMIENRTFFVEYSGEDGQYLFSKFYLYYNIYKFYLKYIVNFNIVFWSDLIRGSICVSSEVYLQSYTRAHTQKQAF